MEEKEDFIPDNLQTASEQNLKLSQRLNGSWSDYNIVTIKRIVVGSTTGWKVTYRE